MQIKYQNKNENLIELIPQTLEDLWHLSILINANDKVKATTTRSFQPGEESEKERKKLTLVLEIKKVEFSKSNSQLRLSGLIIDGWPEEYVQKGLFHTFNVQLGHPITIIKNWTEYDLERLKKAIEDTKKPKINVLLMDERKALFALVLGFGIETKWEIEFNASKRLDKNTYNKEKEKFYLDILSNISKVEGKIILAGPGFESKNFYEFVKSKNKTLAANIILEYVSNVEKSGLIELLKKGVVHNIIAQQQVSLELTLMEEFKTNLAKDSKKIAYGIKNIKLCLENNAIDKLLVLDKLLSSSEDIKNLILEAEKKNVKLYIFSSESDGGKELEAFGGLAAFLRYEFDTSPN
jgi:protein pelota